MTQVTQHTHINYPTHVKKKKRTRSCAVSSDGEKAFVASLASPVVAVVPVVSAAQASGIHTQKGGGQLAFAGREGLA